MSLRLHHLLLVACVSLGTLSACVDTNLFRTTPYFYPTAEKNYTQGLKELKAGNWIIAEQYFQHIKTSFAFSHWAALAELGICDTEMGREKYIEAVDDYKAFLRAHPSHERVLDGYVAYRIGEAFYKQIPTDWFIMPPSYEKDQGPVLEALRELGAFNEQYKDSPYTEKAKTMYDDCIRRLADYELYVANFYLKLGKPLAAIGRLEYVVAKYPTARREPETLLLLGRTYLKMEKPAEARNAFMRLVDEHPNDYRVEKARLYVAFIDKRFPSHVDPNVPPPKSKHVPDPGNSLLPDSGERQPETTPGTPTSPTSTSGGSTLPPTPNTPPSANPNQ
jgi:outer membrane protein assembly factor BamD